MAYNFSRTMIGGDIAGLGALSSMLAGYAPQMQTVIDTVNRRVDGLVHDAGWSGGAADQFKRRWQGDAITADVLRQLVLAVAGTVGELATSLRKVESALEQAADEARAAGLPVSPYGELLQLPADANPTLLQAAHVYTETRQYAIDVAQRARFQATGQLQNLESMMGPPRNVATAHPVPSDAWVTVVDTMANLYALPESSRKTLGQQIPKLMAKRDAAHKTFTRAQSYYSKQQMKVPDDIKDARRSSLSALEDANSELDRLERSSNRLMKFFDFRPTALAPIAGLAEDSRVLRAADEIPLVDIGATVVSTGLASYDDMQKGDDATAIPKELAVNVVALGATAVVTGAVIAVGLTIGAPVVLVVGGALVLGAIVGYGVGDTLGNALHEHWDEDIHKYGVVGGIGHGLENVGSNTAKDAQHLVSNIGSGAMSLWHGVFG